MDSTNNPEIALHLSPFLRILKDGRVERLMGTQVVPAGLDSVAGVESKDVVFSPDTGVSARLYLPKIADDPPRKLPLLIYFHGGGFIVESASSPTYHNYLNTLAGEAQIVVVSVDYRLAPEHPLPVAYDDSWAALKWVASHSGSKGPEHWLNSHADFQRVFLAGDSAGGNIAHHMSLRAGAEELGGGVQLKGAILVHPFFWGEDPIGGEAKEAEKRAKAAVVWRLAYPATMGTDDPWINPDKDPNMKYMGCGKVLVCVAGKDTLKYRGLRYCETLAKSGWVGSVGTMEAEDEGHVFHLYNDPKSENVVALLQQMSSFMNED